MNNSFEDLYCFLKRKFGEDIVIDLDVMESDHKTVIIIDNGIITYISNDGERYTEIEAPEDILSKNLSIEGMEGIIRIYE